MDLIVEVYECCFAKSMFNGVMHPNNFNGIAWETHLGHCHGAVARRRLAWTLGGRGGVHDVHVDGIAIGGCFLGVAELQEALDATGTVLRCSAVVSMGQ